MYIQYCTVNNKWILLIYKQPLPKCYMYVYILFVVELKQGFMLNIITIYGVTISCEPKRDRKKMTWTCVYMYMYVSITMFFCTRALKLPRLMQFNTEIIDSRHFVSLEFRGGKPSQFAEFIFWRSVKYPRRKKWENSEENALKIFLWVLQKVGNPRGVYCSFGLYYFYHTVLL